MTGYELKPRSTHWLPRLLNKFGGGAYWMTIGNTIYYPDVYDLETAKLFTDLIDHEKVHIEQYKKYTVPGFLFLYVLVPLPIFFAYFRWRFEREAYMVQLRLGVEVEEIVKSLSSGYGYPWPKFLMRSWFNKQLKK